MAYLMQGLGHADRHSGLTGYCTGLMLPLSRKSVEPMAARVDPLHASAKHQSLHHFVVMGELMACLSKVTVSHQRAACAKPAGGAGLKFAASTVYLQRRMVPIALVPISCRIRDSIAFSFIGGRTTEHCPSYGEP